MKKGYKKISKKAVTIEVLVWWLIAVAALAQLAKDGEIKSKVVREALAKYRLDDISAAEAGNTEGSG